MRQIRFDNPKSTPQMRVDALPKQGRRVTVSNDPRPAAKRKADTKPTAVTTPTQPKRRDPIKDARDRTSARRDAALARIRNRYQEARK